MNSTGASAMSGLSETLTAGELVRTGSNLPRGVGGQKLLPNEREQKTTGAKIMRWVSISALALAYFGILSRGYMYMTCQPCHSELCDCCQHENPKAKEYNTNVSEAFRINVGVAKCYDDSQCWAKQRDRWSEKHGTSSSEKKMEMGVNALLCPRRPLLDAMAGDKAPIPPLVCDSNDRKKEARRSNMCSQAYMMFGAGIAIFLLSMVGGAISGDLQEFIARAKRKKAVMGGYLITLGNIIVLVTLPKLAQIMWENPHWRPHDVAWMVAGA